MVGGTERTNSQLTIVSQHFHPEPGGSALRITELAVGLQHRGWEVTVITSQPSYGEDSHRSRRLPWRSRHEGVSVRRVPATRFDRNGGIQYRLLNDLTFFISAVVYLLIFRRDTLTLLTTTPPFLPTVGALIDRISGSPHVILCHDLYPAVAIRLGYLSEDGPVARLWAWLNQLAYDTAGVVVVLGENMRQTVQNAYGEACNVSVIHNWEDGKTVRPMSKSENGFATTHGLVDRFTIVYSGNHGQLHELESVVEAATVLEKKHENLGNRLQFLFIGDGYKKERLQQRVAEQSLETVRFLPYQPMDGVDESLTCGDVALVSTATLADGVCVPGKFYTALASGQAVLAIAEADSDIGRIVDSTDCGVRVAPDAPSELADVIEDWLAEPERAAEMGRAARALFESNFSKNRAITEFDDELSRLVDRNQSSKEANST